MVEMPVSTGVKERDVAREETRSTGRLLLRRQTAQETQTERQRPRGPREASSPGAMTLIAALVLSADFYSTGLMRPEVRLEAQQVGDGETFGTKSGAAGARLVGTVTSRIR